MNVAITRAKRALWVLGSRATLRANREWDALIWWAGCCCGAAWGVGALWRQLGAPRCRCMWLCVGRAKQRVYACVCTHPPSRSPPTRTLECSDAEQRGVVIADAEARDLFPNLPYWQEQAAQQAQQAQQAPAAAAAGQSRPPSREPTPQQQQAPPPLPLLPGQAGGAAPAGQHRQVAAPMQRAAPLAAAPPPQPVHPHQLPPRPMISYQEVRKLQAPPPQQQQQGPAAVAAPPNGPMQRLAPAAGATQPAAVTEPGAVAQPAAAAVRPMQRQGGSKRAAYPQLPTRR